MVVQDGTMTNNRCKFKEERRSFSPGGQPGNGADCMERLCHPHPCRLSKPDWSKPWAAWSDLRSGPALSRKLDWKPPEVSTWIQFQPELSRDSGSTELATYPKEISPLELVPILYMSWNIFYYAFGLYTRNSFVHCLPTLSSLLLHKQVHILTLYVCMSGGCYATSSC